MNPITDFFEQFMPYLVVGECHCGMKSQHLFFNLHHVTVITSNPFWVYKIKQKKRLPGKNFPFFLLFLVTKELASLFLNNSYERCLFKEKQGLQAPGLASEISTQGWGIYISLTTTTMPQWFSKALNHNTHHYCHKARTY